MGLRLSYPSHNRDSKKGNLVNCSDGVFGATPAFFVEFVDVVLLLLQIEEKKDTKSLKNGYCLGRL